MLPHQGIFLGKEVVNDVLRCLCKKDLLIQAVSWQRKTKPIFPNTTAACRKIILNFLLELLEKPENRSIIKWEDRKEGVFKILQPEELAIRWGTRKNVRKMTYDKMSRALRYYYKDGTVSKSEKKLCYRFNWKKLSQLKVLRLKGLKEEPVDLKDEFMVDPTMFGLTFQHD